MSVTFHQKSILVYCILFVPVKISFISKPQQQLDIYQEDLARSTMKIDDSFQSKSPTSDGTCYISDKTLSLILIFFTFEHVIVTIRTKCSLKIRRLT